MLKDAVEGPGMSSSILTTRQLFREKAAPIGVVGHANSFPAGAVRYPICCGPICLEHGALGDIVMYKNMRRMFDELARRFNGAKELTESDVVLALYYHGDRDNDNCLLYTSPSPRDS